MSVWRVSLPLIGLAISRGQLMAGLFLFTSTSGLLPQVIRSIRNEEWYKEVSLVPSTPALLFGAPGPQHVIWRFRRLIATRIRPLDIAVACGTFAIAALPATSLSWVALSFFSAYVYLTSSEKTPLRRSAIIFFAMCVPLLWAAEMVASYSASGVESRRVFGGHTDWSGAHRQRCEIYCEWRCRGCSGDTDLAGVFVVGNISHAALAWVALTQTLGRDLETKDVYWCGLAMILAASVNLARLCMTAVSFENYAIFHGPLGEQIAGILTIFLIASVCIFGQRRELFART